MTPRSFVGRLPLRETFLWTAAVVLFWGLDTLTRLEDRDRSGVGLDDFRLFTEQATSAAAALIMVLFVAWWLKRFPLGLRQPLRTVAAHVLGSALFAAGHYALMVAMRVLVFHANGMHYAWQHDHLENLVFEYQKDIKIYLGMVGVIAAYRHLASRRQERSAAARPPAAPGQLLVQTGSGERLIDIAQVEYLQAARNYVSVHTGGREYIVRETMSNLEARLAPGNFLRTHRSFMVNAACIVGMRPVDSGSWEVQLGSGTTVPLSRGYRDAVREELRRAAQPPG